VIFESINSNRHWFAWKASSKIEINLTTATLAPYKAPFSKESSIEFEVKSTKFTLLSVTTNNLQSLLNTSVTLLSNKRVSMHIGGGINEVKGVSINEVVRAIAAYTSAPPTYSSTPSLNV
jgi:hypothetical protein